MCRLASGTVASKSASESALLSQEPPQQETAPQTAAPAPAAPKSVVLAPTKHAVKTKTATAENTLLVEATRAKSWSRLVDKKTLGGHYDYVVGQLGTGHSAQEELKAQHDVILAQDGCAQAGRSGFTDRSRRLREGKGARETLMPAGARFQTSEAASLQDTKLHGKQHSAGQVSQHVSYNKPPRYEKAGQAHVTRATSDTFDSRKLVHTLDETAGALKSARAERSFVAEMGRKTKAVAAPKDKGPFCGDHDSAQSCPRLKLRTVTAPAKSSSRTGVAMALQAKASDPPLRTNSVAQSKAKAEFASGASEEARRHATERNPEVFRFADAKPKKGGGAASQKQQQKLPKSQKPQKHSAGVTSSSQDRVDVAATPRKSKMPTPSRNESSNMAKALDVDGAHRDARTVRAQRQQQERAFADICKFTVQSRQSQLENSRCIKSTLGSLQSSGVASQLVWN